VPAQLLEEAALLLWLDVRREKAAFPDPLGFRLGNLDAAPVRVPRVELTLGPPEDVLPLVSLVRQKATNAIGRRLYPFESTVPPRRKWLPGSTESSRGGSKAAGLLEGGVHVPNRRCDFGVVVETPIVLLDPSDRELRHDVAHLGLGAACPLHGDRPALVVEL